ncbi:hypothetical protein BDN71DRAFT_1502686 [Pleurotus eryngii]|uniref:Uncharacterized protein n=1 Tax=Pleurotus eryngii TaxID=5323 RepID=A0A9P6A473_PLEER|nr:hypothetical protein BDN71DRAFT_1502686 [Pleurotus eryngii]
MYSDSDTESDSGASDVANTQEPYSSLPYFSSTPAEKPRIGRDVENAVEELGALDIGESDSETELHQLISSASTAICSFLDSVNSGEQDGFGLKDILALAVMLFDPLFLETLFEHRHHFHRIATLSTPQKSSVVVCWADSVLVKLSEFAVSVASGLSNSSNRISMPNGLSTQWQDDSLRGAAQIPYKWTSLPGVLSSEQASPAAKRIVSRLLFGVFVIRPQLHECNPWDSRTTTPLQMMEIISGFLRQIVMNRPLVGWFELQERITQCILIVLFTLADLNNRRQISRSGALASPWKPRTLGVMLEMIECNILQPKTGRAVGPADELDVAQTILLRWGSTIPWSWTVWRDLRIARAECIVQFTLEWLCRLEQPLFHGAPSLSHWTSDVTPHIEASPSAAKAIMMGLLNLGNFDARLTSDLCAMFLELFVSLDNDAPPNIPTKALVLEALALADADTWAICMEIVKDKKELNFIARLDDQLSLTRRAIKGAREESLNDVEMNEVKMLLTFLGIMWHNKCHGYVHRQTVSPFLSTLLSAMSGRESVLPELHDSLLTTLSIMESRRAETAFPDVSPYWEDDTVWNLALEAGSCNITVTLAFSQYILSTKRLCDPLTSAEAWSHLRDSMLLILSQQFLQEEAALALIAAPVICQALCLILLNNDQAAKLHSPWTTNLLKELKSLLARPIDDSVDYMSLLRDRITRVGQRLLDAISSLGAASGSDGMPILERELLFCENSVAGAVRRPHRLKSGSESSSTVTAICEVDDRIRQIADISTIHYIQKAFGSILLKSHREEFVVGGTANPAISRLTATSDGVEARIFSAPQIPDNDRNHFSCTPPHHRRCLPSSSFSDDSSSSNWDLDIWRQAKRRRRDSLPSVRNGSHMDIDHFTTMPSTSSGATVRRTTLPSTSIAFQLFPMTGRRTTKTRRSSCQSDSGDIALNDRDADLRGLRTSAFWELHRSIAESGEGFVRRMQDLESSLSQPDILSKGRESTLIGKRRSSIIPSPPCSARLDQMSNCNDDEDDVQILNGEVGVNQWSQLSSSFRDSSQVPLAYRTDDEEATSSSISVHSSPSTTSLPFPSSDSSTSLAYSAGPSALEYPSSHSDKALAALTLALANGAAGLTDFAALQALHAPLAMDECQVGDMWD